MKRLGRAMVIVVGLAAAIIWVTAGRGTQRVEAADRVAASRGQAGPSATPTIQVYSRETVVDVTVTDKDGKPVHGLMRADFAVEEDGKEEAIRGFAEFDKPVPVAGAAAASKLPQNVYSNRWGTPSASPPNVILLGNLTRSECIHAKWAIATYVRSMPAGTQVALFVEARLVQGFTTDAELMIAAMNADPALESCSLPQNPVVQLGAMRAVAAYAGRDKGKKNLIWFTHGIPEVTDPQFVGELADPTPELHHTYGLLAAAQVTVDPVDASGVVVPVAAPPRKIDTNAGAVVAAANMAALGAVGANHLSLESVAEEMGGEALYNTNDLSGAMARAIDGGSSYYTLSYVPPGEMYDGRHHTIHVKVDRPGVHLLYRDEYYAEDPGQIKNEPAQETLAAATTWPDKNTMQTSMERGAPPVNQIVFDVTVQPATETAKKTAAKGKNVTLTRYGFVFTVPAKQIAFHDGPDGIYRGALEFEVVAFGEDGRQVTMLSQTLNMPMTPDVYADFVQQPLKFRQQIDLPAGQMNVRAGIFDKVSKKVGTLEIPLTVTKVAGAAVARR